MRSSQSPPPEPFQALFVLLLTLGICLGGHPAAAAFPRPQPGLGLVASASGEAEISPVEAPSWQTAETEQSLLAGDSLRTGPNGNMALMFNDRTQIRVHRNTDLTVKAIASSGKNSDSLLRLDRGKAWARAAAGGAGVRIETPSATAAIRGTDWSLSVDEAKRTTLIVLDGEVELGNALGKVTVTRGEIAYAEIGKAPTKTVVINPDDREQMLFSMSLSEVLKSLHLTEMTAMELRNTQCQLEAIPPAQRDLDQWQDLLEIAYDQNDQETIKNILGSAAGAKLAQLPRTQMVTGFLAAKDQNHPEAEQLLAKAVGGLDPSRRLTANIGRALTLILLRRDVEAAALVQDMASEQAKAPLFQLFQVLLTAFSGRIKEAQQQALAHMDTFPDYAKFPALYGWLSLLLDQPAQVKRAAELTLALDPHSVEGHQLLSLYRGDYLRDYEGAIDILRQGLSFNERQPELWLDLCSAYNQIDEVRLGVEACRQALTLDPKDVRGMNNLAIILLDMHQIDEAEKYLQEAQRLAPDQDYLYTLQGRLAAHSGRMAEAEQLFLKATAANPANADAALGLAFAYYENGNIPLARQTLANAGRLDQNNPDIPLIESMIESDQAHADQAILSARQAMTLSQKLGGLGFANLAASRGGKTSLGAAFAGLGLDSWADYYNELSFDPYATDNYFFRSSMGRAETSSLFTGLLLEPLSASERNRGLGFFRRPFTDGEIGLSVVMPNHGVNLTETADIQGFSFAPLPVAYNLAASNNDLSGPRDNDDTKAKALNTFLGLHLTPHDRLLVHAMAGRGERGLPGPLDLPDHDDRNETETREASLGYSHFFGARNVLLSRVVAAQSEYAVLNGQPLGSTLSSLDYSLLANYGLEQTLNFHTAGLTDLTDPANPNIPILWLNGPLPHIPSTISPQLDTKQFARLEQEEHSLTLQLRHMLNHNKFDFSYGAEVQRFRKEMKIGSLSFNQRSPGIGIIQNFISPDHLPLFFFGDAVPTKLEDDENGSFSLAHFNVLLRQDNDLWFEGGLFAEVYSGGESDSTRIAPCLGTAWQPAPHDWLRLAYRQETASPLKAPLAPAATVGLTADRDFVAEGGRISSIIGRWDREWHPRIFTAIDVRRRRIHSFSTEAADSLVTFSTDQAVIDEARLDLNLWFNGGVGLFAQSLFRDAEDRSRGPIPNQTLPMVASREYTAGLTWVHPAQLRVNLVTTLVQDRRSGLAEDHSLDDYISTDLSTSWQPLQKRVQLELSVHNLFDHDYEKWPDMPAQGRSVEAAVLFRF